MDYFSAETVRGCIGPHHHRRAARHLWQFQIFTENWAKLSLLPHDKEDSCGDTQEIFSWHSARHILARFAHVRRRIFLSSFGGSCLFP
jgi:hypothetical protein